MLPPCDRLRGDSSLETIIACYTMEGGGASQVGDAYTAAVVDPAEQSMRDGCVPYLIKYGTLQAGNWPEYIRGLHPRSKQPRH